MASSGTLISDKWNKAYWSFEWTSSVVSPGVTKVSWALYAKGRSSSPTKYYTKIELYVNGNQKYRLWDESATFTGTKYSSGSFIVNHDVDGNGSFNVNLYVPKIYDALDWYTTEGNPTLDTNKPYSACGAATLKLDTSKVIVPNGSITLSWFGAEPGTANPIVGYDIYRCITTEKVFDESIATLIASKSASENTYTDNFINNSQSRDKNIIYQIKTIGQATAEANTTNYDSNYSNQILVEINDLPDPPKLKESSTIVPSRGGAVTIKLIIESKSSQTTESTETNQSIVYYYSTNNLKPSALSGLVKVEGDNIQTPFVNKETTFYFWSYDGLEFSENSTNFTVYKNSKPKISFSIEGTSLESVNNKTNYSYINNIKIVNLKGVDGVNQDNFYKFDIGYGKNDNVENAYWNTLDEFYSPTNNTSSYKSSDFDIREKIGFLNYYQDGIYYWIRGKRTDKLEESDVLVLGPYYITKLPSFLGVYNNTINSNIEGFSDFFLNKLYLTFEYDQGYGEVDLKVGYFTEKDGTKIFNGFDLDGKFQYFNNILSYVELNTDDGVKDKNGNLIFPRGDTKTFYYDFVSVTENSSSFSKTKILHLSSLLKSLTAPWSTDDNGSWKVFGIDNNNNFTPSITVGHTGNYSNLNVFGLTKDPKMLLSFKEGSLNKTILFSEGASMDQSTTYNISQNELFDLIPSFFDFNNSNETKLQLSISNNFGETYVVDSNSFKVDFRAKLSNSDFSFAYDTNGNKISTLSYLKELVPLYLNGSVKSYNTNPKGQIYINRSTEGVWQPYGPAFNFIETTSIDPTPGNPRTYSVSNQLIQTIGRILVEKYTASFKIIITTDAGEAYKLDYTFLENQEIRGHFQGAPILNNGQYKAQNDEGNSELLLSFNMEKLGLYADDDSGDATVSMSIYVYQADDPSNFKEYPIEPSTTTLPSYKSFNEFSQTLTLLNDKENPENFNFEGAAYAKIKVKTTLKTEAGFLTTVEYETNEISFFNLVPTISYRQNQIGVNYQNVEETNCILALGEYQDKYILRYYPATDEHPFGEIDNFILDGGTW